jgi:hypothetical protein
VYQKRGILHPAIGVGLRSHNERASIRSLCDALDHYDKTYCVVCPREH